MKNKVLNAFKVVQTFGMSVFGGGLVEVWGVLGCFNGP